ncbi:gamma-glutamylcyclotransferase [Nostocaceae cyanobacterium CENA369]|uniref:Gamma-glutamylcyclotransferase n=1 Tax=Dendronalium phyllosphericum CENA369 TaxID=1725256 RepID=A0A8J7LDZ5_9NOST|nr:gamma-glutamylcyclotransferase [Dendronalium phyllosphericum]MBH8573626.1 gamma-glutamylcyclotransferase [Dendronalium phyllosphericum CENA369]
MTKSKAKFPGLVRVFVYGTLKPGEANYDRYCAGKVVDAQRAFAIGELFALPMGYPAMTIGEHFIHGYLLFFADLKILDILDELEDYQPTRQISQNLYSRQQVEIYNLQGLSLGCAWVYLMTWERVSCLEGVLQPDGWWSGCI